MSPTIGEFHQKYWVFSDTSVTPIGTSKGGYPAWQSQPSGVTLGTSIWGAPAPALLTKFWAMVAWSFSFVVLAVWTAKRWNKRDRERMLATVKILTAMDPERLSVVERTMAVLNDPVYTLAKDGVKQTAQTLGFNQPQAWVKLSHTLKDRQGWAENSWRHLHACHLTDLASRAQGSTLCNRDRHFAVALAYEGFAANPGKVRH